jgi:kynureninase
MQDVVAREWGESLIRGWNDHAWIDLPGRVGDRIGKLIGAAPGTVMAADTTSINLVKALSAGLELRPDRKVILSDTGNFPADLYMAQGLIRALGQGHTLKLVAPEEVEAAIDERVAVLMLTEVDYRTGRRHDMAALTQRAHEAGAIAQWDLAHSAGALPVDVTAAKADFAIGCTYKYLNGGPGAPAFIYVRPDHLARVAPMLSGWMGHEAPFAFDLDYRPAPGTERMTVGTPPVLALSALDAALDVWDGIDMAEVRRKSMALGDLFIEEVEERCAGYGLKLASPREAAERGSQVSFHCKDGYAVMQALIGEGVIGDFRAPDIMRFGFTPLYLRYQDIVDAVAILECILRNELWHEPRYQKRAKVT